VRLFRGGAYKRAHLRTAFKGWDCRGLKILAKVRENYGFGIVTEAIDKRIAGISW